MTPTSSPELSSSQQVISSRANFGAERNKALIALLAQLEASLAASQKALLAADLAELERGTGEQRALCRQIENSFAAGPVPSPSHNQPSGEQADLRATQARVLHLARVQGALLRRAQRSLRVVAGLMAHPTYAPQQWHVVPQR
jgi:hypothetical protein